MSDPSGKTERENAGAKSDEDLPSEFSRERDADPDEDLQGWADHGFPGGFLGILLLLSGAFGAGYLAYWLAGLLMYR